MIMHDYVENRPHRTVTENIEKTVIENCYASQTLTNNLSGSLLTVHLISVQTNDEQREMQSTRGLMFD